LDSRFRGNDCVGVEAINRREVTPRERGSTSSNRDAGDSRNFSKYGPCENLLAGGFTVPKKLSHYDETGRARMVDVTEKAESARFARAAALVKMNARTRRAVRNNPKGDPLEIARIAGIAAAKRTADLIPLCHPLLLTHVDVTVTLSAAGVRIESSVRTSGPTGVEMEALTAAAVAALTVYDMCKALDRSIEITDVRLLEKTGGKSGHYQRRKPQG
jgi:cyclic pyranopterin monophosphate synthase